MEHLRLPHPECYGSELPKYFISKESNEIKIGTYFIQGSTYGSANFNKGSFLSHLFKFDWVIQVELWIIRNAYTMFLAKDPWWVRCPYKCLHEWETYHDKDWQQGSKF